MNFTDTLHSLMAIISHHPVLERLFFASLEFAVLALIMGIVIRVARIRSARLIAVLWLLVLAKPIASLAIGSPLPIVQFEAPAREANTARPPGDLQSRDALVTSSVISAPRSQVGSWMALDTPDLRRASRVGEIVASPMGGAGTQLPATSSRMSWLSNSWLNANAGRAALIVWITGIVFFVGLSVLDRIRLRRLVAAARDPSPELSARYATIASSLGVKRLPNLRQTDDLESPALAGLLAPVVLVPSWLIREQESAKLDWSLRHELMHWKLLDPLASVVRELAQTLFYFHPAAWWVGKKWEEAVEMACDRAIVNNEADSQNYAEQLYQIMLTIRHHRRVQVSSGLFATRTQIGRRIAALLASPLKSPAQLSLFALMCVAVLSVVTLAVGGAFVDASTPHEEKAADVASPSKKTNEPPDQRKESKRGTSANPPDKSPSTSTRTRAPEADSETVTIKGHVLDPDGKPLSRATLQLEYPHQDYPAKQKSAEFRTTTDSGGGFQFKIAKSQFDKSSYAEPWKYARVFATADGYGFDQTELTATGQEITLRLVKDVPINGRILDLEGKPLAGATIRLRDVRWTPGESLDGYIQAMREARHLSVEFKRLSGGASIEPVLTTTGPDGRFRLHGMGAERLVSLNVEGPNIEHWFINVMTRETEMVVLPDGLTIGRTLPDRAYGATFDHLAAPSRAIVGTVRDKSTGKPLAGVSVRGRTLSHAKTDEAGRYQLLGYAKSTNYSLEVLPTEAQPYFGAQLFVADVPGLEPLQANVELQTGTLARGRLTDDSSGQPIAGRVEYYPLFPNANVNKLSWTNMPCSAATIKADGQFVLPVLAGPGVLAFAANGGDTTEYASAYVSAEELREVLKGTFEYYNDRFLNVARGGQTQSSISQENYHALVLINPAEDMESLTKDVALEKGRQVRGTVLGPDGQPLAGVTAFGLKQHYFASDTLEGAEFQVTQLHPRRTRTLLFSHAEKKVGLALEVRGHESAPLTVHLQPLGAATGRLLDKDGEPMRDAVLQFYRDRLIGPGGCSTRTDRDGRFRVEGLVPGQTYQATLLERVGVYQEVRIDPGETKNLGEARIGADGQVQITKL